MGKKEMKENGHRSKKIRKGDLVVAIAGNYRGQTGIVQCCFGEKVIVQGLNFRKKHIKKTKEVPMSRILDIEEPIHISNLKVCVEGDTAAKLKVRINEQGDRQFVYRNGDQEKVYRSVKKPK
jgi:large subunit ribosomal protein L24